MINIMSRTVDRVTKSFHSYIIQTRKSYVSFIIGKKLQTLLVTITKNYVLVLRTRYKIHTLKTKHHLKTLLIT